MSKHIAILGSSKAEVFENIVNYIKIYNSDTQITCLSNNLESDILKKAKQLGIVHQYLPFEENTKYFANHNFDLGVLTEYNQDLSVETLESCQFINIHPSLLPSFKGKDAIYRAYSSGVKVSGVTIYKLNSAPEKEQIIAQYPVLIGTTTHFDEFEKEIYDIENTLYPPVINAILEDKVFDFQDLFKNKCNNKQNCGGCNKCQG